MSALVDDGKGWQPIETAPIAPGFHCLISDGQYVMIGWFNVAADGWYNQSCHRLLSVPTHWQHIPAAPESPQ